MSEVRDLLKSPYLPSELSYPTTCFYLNPGDAVSHLRLPPAVLDNEPTSLEYAIHSLCSSNEDSVTVVPIQGAVKVSPTETLASPSSPSSSKAEFPRGTHVTLTPVTPASPTLTCVSHPGCSHGAFHAQLGLLSLSGWTEVRDFVVYR